MIDERLALVSRKCRTAAHIPGPWAYRLEIVRTLAKCVGG